MSRTSLLIIKTIVLILPLLAKGQQFNYTKVPTPEGVVEYGKPFFPGGNLNPVNDNTNLEDILGVRINTKSTGISTKMGQSCTTPNGNIGTCSYIYESQCSNVLDAIKNNWRSDSLKLWNRYDVINYLRRAIQSPCGFEQTDYTLCCGTTYVLFQIPFLLSIIFC